MSSTCDECGVSFGCMSSPKGCPGCKDKLLCHTCGAKHPLIVFDPSNPEDTGDISENKTVQCFCKSCFQEKSLLDFPSSSTVVAPEGQSNGITLVFAHPAGGSRAMFMPYAKILAPRGYKSILFDFPGHGALVEQPLSLDTCVERVKSVLSEYNLKNGDKTIYIGGSFGAYLGFLILQECKGFFKSAVLMDCGQNVGPGASLKAKAGLWMLKAIANATSNKSMTELMVGALQKSPAKWKIIESTFGAGFFFDQGAAQVECLKGVAPAEIIPGLDIPILFFNGSEDYRDSENLWLDLCKNKDSELKVYEGGDHFFSHDERFVNDILERIHTFATKTSSKV